jgi:glycosyltransferase involved in cell wall biosynthesis
MTITVSVVIRCYNSAETLGETLEALLAQDWSRPWEVVLADNGSTDDSIGIFLDHARRHPDRPMRVIDASQRRGPAHSANAGVAAARGRSVIFCDSDDVPAPGWLRTLGEALDRHEFVAAVGESRTLNPDWIGEYKTWHTGFRLGQPPYCLCVGLGMMGIRKSLFEALGGVDPDCSALEDIDFCIRAHQRGSEPREIPEAVVAIRFRRNLEDLADQAFSWSFNTVRLYKRYRHLGPELEGRWTQFLKHWALLARWYLAKAVLRKPQTMADRARFRATLARENGRLAGMIAFRSPPNTGRPPRKMHPAATRKAAKA